MSQQKLLAPLILLATFKHQAFNRMKFQPRDPPWFILLLLTSTIQALIFLFIFLKTLTANNMVTIIANAPIILISDAPIADRTFCVCLDVLDELIVVWVVDVIG